MPRTPNCGSCNKPKSQCKCGRPRVITPEVIDKLEWAIRRDCTIKMACSYASISVQAYYDELKVNKQFADRMDSAEDYLHILSHTKMADKIEEGEREVIKEFKKKRDTRYKDKSEVDNTVDLNIDWSNVPPETLAKRARGGK